MFVQVMQILYRLIWINYTDIKLILISLIININKININIILIFN
jgi:hypothetical protein